jgi:signal transduction histidine kinase
MLLMYPEVLSAFFDCAPEAFAVVGEDLCIHRKNAEFTRLLERMGCEESFAQKIAEGGSLYVCCKAVMTDAMTRPFSIQAEGGSKKTVSGKVFLVRDGTRRVVGIMAKEGEPDFASGEQDLGAQAQRIQEMQREMEAFSYSVSHDLRAPVRAVIGFSQALEHEIGKTLPKQTAEYINRVKQSAERIGQLIDHLLRFSRAARHEPVKVTVDVSEIGQSVAKEVAKRTPDQPGVWTIQSGMKAQTDEKYVRELLNILFENAQKFSQPDARIELGSRTEAGEIQYYVKDNGVGYDPDYAEKLFTPLQRLHAADEFPGEGMGLAIARKIVGRLGGKIWAESTPGNGATFFFTVGG